MAEASVEHGAYVCISGSNQQKLDNAISRLRSAYPQHGSNISGQVCDLSHADRLEASLEALLSAAAGNARIDHIVFTAGDPLQMVPIAEATVDAIQKSSTVRFLAPLIAAKLAPRFMSPGPSSSITFTSGTNVQRPKKDWTVPVAWGGGTESSARGLAVDLAPIRVNVVSPGAVHTELFNGVPKEKLDGLLQSFRDASLVGKVGRPEDLAEAYLYCMKCGFVTGTVMQCDGGRLLK